MRFLIGLSLIFVLEGPTFALTLKEAETLLQSGQYAKAEAAFKQLARSRQRVRALLGLGRVQLETGRYADAVRTANKVRGKRAATALTLAGEARRQAGDLPAAEATLRRVIQRYPQHYRARIYLGMVYLEQAKTAEAKATFDLFYDDFDSDKIDKKSAEQLTYVAMACRYADNFRDASDTLQDALKLDGKHLETFIQLAEISLEKYEAAYAEAHYTRALKVNPHHAGALIGLARVKLELTNDVEGAFELLKKAKQSNPHSIDIQVIQAQILIDGEQTLEAEKILTKALQRNPRHLGAMTMMAASFFMRDDRGSFERMRAKVLKHNPRYTEFFRTVVKLAVRHHRYLEAIALSKRAIQIDPHDWYSLADLGTNYLRLGDEKHGLQYLRAAWKGDPYNVRNYNLLNLFEDVVAKQYTYISSKHFRLRVHKTEKEIIQRTIVPLMERAYRIYVKKYRFTPKGPIILELFRDPQHYAIRTVGLPQFGAIGVCFGRVITSSTPTSGRFNWGQVLWHELNHVFTIQMSRSRVPRWLTEGLADMEPVLERPEWKREHDFQIYKALRAGRLKGLASMGTAFSRAKDIQEMVLAYYQGGLMAIYLIKHWGMAKMLDALHEYSKGKRTSQIMRKMTGLSLEELDRRFHHAELRRLAHYKRNWHVDHRRYVNLERYQQAAKARPQDPGTRVQLAVALLIAGKLQDAQKQAKQILESDKSNRLALYVSAKVALVKKERTRAEALLNRLIAAGGDGYETRLALGRLAFERKDLGAAVRHLAAAKRFDPERGLPYVLLTRAYERAKQTDRIIKELEALSKLEQQSFPMLFKLVKLLVKKKDFAAVRKYGEMAYYIQPASARLHAYLADAYTAAAPKPRLARAIWHLETALHCRPEHPADLHYLLASLHLKRKDRRPAQAHLAKALKADPNHAKSKAMIKKIKKIK